MFFDMDSTGKRAKRNVGLATRNPHLRRARQSVIELMQPILRRLPDNTVLVNRHDPRVRFTPAELKAEWKKGRYIRGPLHWRISQTEVG